MAVWINSTFGLIMLLSMAEVTRGPWVDFKKEPLQKMLVLDVDGMRRRAKPNLLNLYGKKVAGREISKSELKALPSEFGNPTVRKEIDDEICAALGLDLKLDVLYKLLSKEPMLTG